MNEKLYVHVDMFKPDPPPGIREVEHQMLARLVGEPGRELVEGIRGGAFSRYRVPEDLRDRVNTHFANAIRGEFGIPEGLDVRSFWKNREIEAVGVHYYVKDRFPDLHLGIGTEVTTCTGDFSDILEILATEGLTGSSPENADNRLRFEYKRRWLYATLATILEVDSLEHDLAKELRKIENVTAEHLFQGPQGETKLTIKYAYHDDVTNAVVGLEEMLPLFAVEGATLKRYELETRDAMKAGRVFYDSRVKPRFSELTKSVDRGYKNGGVIDSLKDVQDRFGFVVVTMDPKIKPKYLSNRIGGLLRKYYRPIEEIIREDEPDKDRGQSEELNWYRAKYKFAGVPTIFEVMIFNTAEWIEYKTKIGLKKPDGFYSGGARPLWEVQRLMGSLGTGYPYDMYRVDAKRAVVERMEDLIPEIMKVGSIDAAKPVNLEALGLTIGTPR